MTSAHVATAAGILCSRPASRRCCLTPTFCRHYKLCTLTWEHRCMLRVILITICDDSSVSVVTVIQTSAEAATNQSLPNRTWNTPVHCPVTGAGQVTFPCFKAPYQALWVGAKAQKRNEIIPSTLTSLIEKSRRDIEHNLLSVLVSLSKGTNFCPCLYHCQRSQPSVGACTTVKGHNLLSVLVPLSKGTTFCRCLYHCQRAQPSVRDCTTVKGHNLLSLLVPLSKGTIFCP